MRAEGDLSGGPFGDRSIKLAAGAARNGARSLAYAIAPQSDGARTL